MVLTLLLCFLWMRLINLLRAKNLLSSSVSRKIVHIGTGPLFLLCWLLFPDLEISRYMAALVPLLIVLQILLITIGILKDESSIDAMARNGDKRELLKGPLFYGVMIVLITVFFWETPHAILSLIILCVGDGVADLIGSRSKSKKLIWSKSKTYAGSLAMFIGSTAVSLLYCWIFIAAGRQSLSIVNLLPAILIISLAATLVESITPSDFDNITVPAAALIATQILL